MRWFRAAVALVFAGGAFGCANGPSGPARPDHLDERTRAARGAVTAYPESAGPDPDLEGVRLCRGLPELDQARQVQAVLEIDRSHDLPELPLATVTHDGSTDLCAALADVGIHLEVVWDDLLTPGELAEEPWPGEERLRGLMERHRSLTTRPAQWHLYLLLGRKLQPDRELSLLIDPESRTGAVAFVDPSPAAAAATLHAIGHEIGHLLNLPHPWEAYGNTRSLMTYPWRWKDWDWGDPAAFRFDAVGRRHILRDPERFVRPGAGPYPLCPIPTTVSDGGRESLGAETQP